MSKLRGAGNEKPKLTLIKSEVEHAAGLTLEMPPEIKEMLREMNRRQRKQDDPDTPDAA